MTKRILALLLALLFLTGAFPHMATAADTPTAKKPVVGGQLNLPLEQEPDSFNPIISSTAYGAAIYNQVYATLFSYNEKWEPIPNVAESWKVSADGLTWTIAIRKGALFHDGTELIAEDVVFTYQSIMDPGYTGPRKSNAQPIKAISAPDRYTVKVELKEPLAYVYSSLNLGILSKKQFAGVAVKDFATHQASLKPIGAGPYKFVEYKKGSHVTLERNPNWFRSKELGGAPFISTLRFPIYIDWPTMYDDFTNGKIDLLRLESYDVTDKIRAQAAPYTYERNGWGYFTINNEKPYLSDKRVRQALTYALDRAYINRRVYGGAASVPAGPIPPLSWAFDSTLKPLAHDAVKAMDLLEEAGYRQNAQGWYEKDGKQLKLTINFVDNPNLRNVASLVDLYWTLIGIDVTVQFKEFPALTADMTRGNFDISYSGFSLALDPDQFDLFHSSQVAGFNRARYKNPEVDSLLVAGRKESDPKKRKEIYAQFQRKVVEDAPVILMNSARYTDWVSKRVKGGVVNFPGSGPTDFFRWWIVEQ